MKQKGNGSDYLMRFFFALMGLAVFAYFIVGEIVFSPDHEKLGIWIVGLEKYGIEVLIALFLVGAGITSVLFSIILRTFYQQKVVLGYLGWGVFFVAVWMLSNSKLKEFLFSDVSLIGEMAFCMVMLIPLPFLIYMNNLQKQRYQAAYTALAFVMVIAFAAYAVLRIFGMDRWFSMALYKRVEILLATVLVVGTMALDCIHGKIQEYSMVAIGFVGFLSTSFFELLMALSNRHSNRVALGLGLMFLLVMAVLKTGKDIIHSEEEKQQTIRTSESKDRFLANMSHEIRTPINTVIGMNEMILRESPDEEIQEYARNIQRASKMLLSLINDILDFSRIEAGKLDLAESPYQLASLLNDEIHVLEMKAEKKGLKVLLNIDEGMPALLRGDEVRIKQILTNLLTNSVKYTPKGTITFSAQGEWSDSGDFSLKMSVADTGIGIKREDIDKLFDSFTRLEEKKNSAVEGTGLGLNITKHLVDQMGGQITVQSVYGKGSIFTVVIPQEVMDDAKMGNLQQAYEQEIKEGSIHKQTFRAPGANVLVVDDNEMNLAVAKGLLKETQIQLDLASGGHECLELCRKKTYDLILMDHMMPEPDGVETLHLLCEEEENPNRDTKVIALTANALPGVRERYIQEGFADYLAKPIEVEKLEHILTSYLPEELVILEDAPVQTENAKVPAPSQEERPEGQSAAEPAPTEDSEGQSVVEPALTEDLEESSAAEPAQAEAPAASPLILRDVGLSYCGGDEAMYEKVLRVYYDQSRKYKPQLEQYYQERDWKNYEILVHAIKSNSMGIGAKDFSEEAKMHERAAREGDEKAIDGGYGKLYQDYLDVLGEVRQILHLDDAGAAPEAHAGEDTTTGEAGAGETAAAGGGDAASYEACEPERYHQICEALLEDIRTFEMNEALDKIDLLMGLQIPGEDPKAQHEALSRIREAVDDFDYDQAETVCLEWLGRGGR